MSNAQNKATMNNVTTSRIYSGAYTINVETAEGNTFRFRLENERGGIVPTSLGYVWSLTEEDEKVDLCCAKMWQTKREAVNWLKRYRLEDNVVTANAYGYDY